MADKHEPCVEITVAATKLKQIEPIVNDHDKRLRLIEARIAFIAGGAAAAGGWIGTVLAGSMLKVSSWFETITAYFL